MERREVQITIKSTQHDMDDKEDRNVYTGHYAWHKGEHFISFEETLDENERKIPASRDARIKNLFKISDHTVSLSKSGPVTTKMYFEKSKKYYDVYKTPFGCFSLMIQTRQLHVLAAPENLRILLNYDLFLNQGYISNCTIQMEICFLS